MTLCIVHVDDKVLLGMRKRGFGKVGWNGFGGIVQHNESIEEGAIRELSEEARIVSYILHKFRIINFEFLNIVDVLEVHIFKVKTYTGQIGESEEIRP